MREFFVIYSAVCTPTPATVFDNILAFAIIITCFGCVLPTIYAVTRDRDASFLTWARAFIIGDILGILVSGLFCYVMFGFALIFVQMSVILMVIQLVTAGAVVASEKLPDNE